MQKISSIVTIAALAAAASVNAAQLLDFKTSPISPTTPEFVLNQSVVTLGAGAGRLVIEVPFAIPGAPNGTITPAGTTVFQDVSMVAAPAGLVGPTAVTNLGPGFSLLSTAVHTTTVSFFANVPGAAPVLLLRATTGDSVLVGLAGSNTASIETPALTYDGTGVIGSIIGVVPGSASYSLNDVTPGVGLNGNRQFNDFTANATGLFSIVPEPSVGGVIGLVMAAGLGRRRR